jgi:hypothetical protein
MRVEMEIKIVSKVGFYSAVLTTLLTLISFGIAISTPPLSGPFCTGGCYTYPYSDIASRFPRDYYWMYPAMILNVVYYVLMVAIHYFAPVEKKIFSHIGLSFAFLSMATFVIDYFLQVSVIQPSLILGETDGIALLSQFNAHGVFIVLEEIAFIMMSMSMLFMAPVFVGKTKSEKALRGIFTGSFLLNAVSFALISAFYGISREYRFEVAAFTINWLALIASGILLSIVFRRSLGAEAPNKKAQLSTQGANL